jgi:hypothetical protein
MVSIKQGTASFSYSIMAALSRGFTGMVRLKRWASCNSGSNRKTEHLCCDLFCDISIVEVEATMVFSKRRDPNADMPEEQDLPGPPYLVDFTDIRLTY